MRCGHAIESCGSEWFLSALSATISTTPMSHFAGSVRVSHFVGEKLLTGSGTRKGLQVMFGQGILISLKTPDAWAIVRPT